MKTDTRTGIVTPIITKTLQASFVIMEPLIVDDLLALNIKNRNIRESVVETYARALLNGFWVPTNQGIGVSASGFLVDGQHRLEALKAAGYPEITMLLVTGLPDDAVAAVDAGSNRKPRDYLKFMFETSVSAFVSAILRTSMLARVGFAMVKFQPQEYASTFETLGESISEIIKLENTKKLPAAVVAALVDAHAKGYQSEVEQFTKALATGEMLEKDNPALVLRNWIANSRGTGGAIRMTERYRKTTRALQAWVDQKPLGRLYAKKYELPETKICI